MSQHGASERELQIQNKQQRICSSYKKPYCTPRKQKDKIYLSDNGKRRQSRRASIICRFTQVRIINSHFSGKQNSKININANQNMNEFDLKLLQKSQQLLQVDHQAKRNLNLIYNMIQQNKKALDTIRKTKNDLLSIYHNSSAIIQYWQRYQQTEKMKNFRLRNDKNTLNYTIKKKFYEIGSLDNQLQNECNSIEKQISIKKQQFTDKIQKLEQITESVIVSQNKQKQICEESKLTKQNLRMRSEKLQIQQCHIFILKIQLNSNFYAGFTVNTKYQDLKLLFDKNFTPWEKNKTKKISAKDMKRYVLLQLYRGWKKLLRKLSYQSTQYQILFGQTYNQTVLLDLQNILYTEQMRASSRKINKTIIISAFGSEQIIKQQLTSQLLSFNNGLIEVLNIQFKQDSDKNEGILQKQQFIQQNISYQQQMKITYRYLFKQQQYSEEIMEVFDILIRPNITREQLIKIHRQPDRRIFCYIDIPYLVKKSEITKYEQVYQFVKKKSMKC